MADLSCCGANSLPPPALVVLLTSALETAICSVGAGMLCTTRYKDCSSYAYSDAAHHLIRFEVVKIVHDFFSIELIVVHNRCNEIAITIATPYIDIRMSLLEPVLRTVNDN